MAQSTSVWGPSPASQDLCVRCGIPLDSHYFDESKIDKLPDKGHQIVLARFELNPQYCGVLEYFSQFTDLLAANPAAVETPGLDWMILANGRPLAPYLNFDRILNPWGYGSFQVGVRLDDSATIELVVRNRVHPQPGQPVISRVGGRLVGRYWYDAAEGNVARGRR